MVFPLSIKTSVIGTATGPLPEHLLKHSRTKKTESRNDFRTDILVVQGDLPQRKNPKIESLSANIPDDTLPLEWIAQEHETASRLAAAIVSSALRDCQGTALNAKLGKTMPACGAVPRDEMTTPVGGFIAGCHDESLTGS